MRVARTSLGIAPALQCFERAPEGISLSSMAGAQIAHRRRAWVDPGPKVLRTFSQGSGNILSRHVLRTCFLVFRDRCKCSENISAKCSQNMLKMFGTRSHRGPLGKFVSSENMSLLSMLLASDEPAHIEVRDYSGSRDTRHASSKSQNQIHLRGR